MIYFVPGFGNAARHVSDEALERGSVYYADRARNGLAKHTDCHRVVCHMPFGWNSGEVMDFDAYCECEDARNPPLKRLAHSYVEAVSVLLDERTDLHWYTYLGCPFEDPHMVERMTDHTAYVDRFWRSLYPVQQLAERYPGRVGLMLDKSHQIPYTHRLAGLLLSLHHTPGMLPLVVEGGTSVQAWQADAGFGRYMIYETFKASLGQPLTNWPGEQIVQPNAAAQFRRQDAGWQQQMEDAGFTVCGY